VSESENGLPRRIEPVPTKTRFAATLRRGVFFCLLVGGRSLTSNQYAYLLQLMQVCNFVTIFPIRLLTAIREDG
jgi:hypothetical protein